MSQRASQASSASLRAVNLAAVQANLRALGHNVDEAQLIGMLKSIDISEVLGRSARGTPESVPQAGAGSQSSASASTAMVSHRSRVAHNDEYRNKSSADGNSGGAYTIDSAASTSSMRHRGSSSSSKSYLSELSADILSELSFQVQSWLQSSMMRFFCTLRCSDVDSSLCRCRMQRRTMPDDHPPYPRAGLCSDC